VWRLSNTVANPMYLGIFSCLLGGAIYSCFRIALLSVLIGYMNPLSNSARRKIHAVRNSVTTVISDAGAIWYEANDMRHTYALVCASLVKGHRCLRLGVLCSTHEY